MRARLALLAALAALCSCYRQATTETQTHAVRDVERAAEEEKHSAMRVESGATIIDECEGRAEDCARALAPPEAVDAGPSEADAGTVKVRRTLNLPIGADPRLPPSAVPAAPARIETDATDAKAKTAEHEHAAEDLTVKQHTDTRIGPPWWLWLLGGVAILAAGALLLHRIRPL